MKIKRSPLILPQRITPIVGFILQKDVYTTNLLYAYDKFSTKSLRKNLPFRKISIGITNPDSCITVYKEKTPNLGRNEGFIMEQKLLIKPKKLRKRRLKFPLPKMKTVPLGNSVLNVDVCKEDIRIRYLKDDSNITSRSNIKFIYNLRTKTHGNLKKNDFSVSFNKDQYKYRKTIKLKSEEKSGESEKQNYYHPLKTFFSENKIIYERNIKFDKIHKSKDVKNLAEKSVYELKKEIYQINDDLRNLNLKEKERKFSFYKKDFFPTQIYNKINMKKEQKH